MITCHFCGATAPDTDAAIAADWVPTLWLSGLEAVCPSCRAARLRWDDDSDDWVEITIECP